MQQRMYISRRLYMWLTIITVLVAGCGQDDIAIQDKETESESPNYTMEIDPEQRSLYALTVVGRNVNIPNARAWDLHKYHIFLLAHGYNKTVSPRLMEKYNNLFLVEPTKAELHHVADELMKYTDGNDIIRFGIVAHAICGNISLYKGDEVSEIVNLFAGDDYGRQDIDINTCYSKCQIGRITTPNTVAMGPCWGDEKTRAVLLTLKKNYIRDYWWTMDPGSNWLNTSVGEWNIHNSDITVRRLFNAIYEKVAPPEDQQLSPAQLKRLVQSHPYLRITDSDGNVVVRSTREGEIIGHHAFLDHVAIPMKGDVELGYHP